MTEDDILETLSRLSGIPVAKLSQSDTKKYLNLEAELHKRVIGQEEAISAVSRAIRSNQSGIRTGHRPIGSFMFLGPTGVGKTELAKALAEVLLMMNLLLSVLICLSIWRNLRASRLKWSASRLCWL